MIDSEALPNGGIRIKIEGKSHDMPAEIASAFISQLLFKMQKQAELLGDNTPAGGAILYPDSAAVEFERETNEPRIRLGFGKAMFAVSMPKGEMRKLAQTVVSRR